MNNGIVADGWSRLWDFKSGLRAKIKEKYAVELASANATEAALIRSKMEAELQKEWEKASPSPYALFNQCAPIFKNTQHPKVGD
ncbi:MAG: hypothetical protein JWQ71_2831 [Pedosphaera sp.]|nr:hypothetical protein [Pedosphaera sp.]